MTQHEWYYAANGQQMGPVRSDELKRLAASGELQAGDLVWREGLSDWTAASNIAGLFAGAAAPLAAQPVAVAAPPHQRAIEAHQAASTYAAQASSNVLPYGGGGHGSAGAVVTPRTVELLSQTRPWCLFFAVLGFIITGLCVLGGLGMFLMGLVGAIGSNAGGPIGALGAGAGLLYLAVGLFYFVPALYLSRYASRIAKLRGSGQVDDLEGALEAQKSFWKFLGITVLVVIGLYVLVIVAAIAIAVLS